MRYSREHKLETHDRIVKRTTPRASRSTPQWELSMCMSGLAIKGCIGVGFVQVPG